MAIKFFDTKEEVAEFTANLTPMTGGWKDDECYFWDLAGDYLAIEIEEIE